MDQSKLETRLRKVQQEKARLVKLYQELQGQLQMVTGQLNGLVGREAELVELLRETSPKPDVTPETKEVVDAILDSLNPVENG